jgi:hypothetical protein
VVTHHQAIGPGTVRVGRFIGRVGVVSLPAVGAGLDLDQRVVRRHVAKLESAGWLIRAPWLWGEGSVAWLTGAGIAGVGLDGLRAIKSPPLPTTITHGVLVGWSAARIEHRGRIWRSARELEIEHGRWAVPARCERGFTEQLPDLAVWRTPDQAPIALISERGGRREDRQKMILGGWRDAITAGRYSGVLYDCTTAPVAHWIERLARKVGLTGLTFAATVQKTAAEIAALSPAPAYDATESRPGPPPRDDGSDLARQTRERPVRRAPTPALTPKRSPVPTTNRQLFSLTEAEREQRLHELLGTDHPPRRRWRR